MFTMCKINALCQKAAFSSSDFTQFFLLHATLPARN